MRTYKYLDSSGVKVWFTADTHFGHGNIIHFCSRPFNSVEEMDAKLIENWNTRVRPEDHVFHLGDFCYHCKPAPYIGKLNGIIHLIIGSHDDWAHNKTAIRFKDFDKTITIDDNATVRIENTFLFLAHHAHRVWPKSHYGVAHLYGHSHGNLPKTATSMDIGVDCTGYTPWCLDEIREELSKNDEDHISRKQLQ